MNPKLLGGAKTLDEISAIRRLRDNRYLLTRRYSCGIDILELSGGSYFHNGACVGTGAIEKGLPCVACQPTVSPMGLTPIVAGKPCSDGDVCTTGGSCTLGKACVGAPISCDDKDATTLDACGAAYGGCFHK